MTYIYELTANQITIRTWQMCQWKKLDSFLTFSLWDFSTFYLVSAEKYDQM